MLKRPSKHDTEEDLLRMQEEFLRQKPKPAVKLVKKPDKRKSESEQETVGDHEAKAGTSASKQPKRVHFKQTAEDDVIHQRMTEEQDPGEAMEDADCHIAKVLTDIVERDIRNQPVYYPIGPLEGGFPKLVQLDNFNAEAPSTEPKQKKRSLFAQQFMKLSAKSFGVKAKQTSSCVSDVVVERDVIKPSSSYAAASSLMSGVAPDSCIVRGDGLNAGDANTEVKRIHEENVEKLSEMSPHEILEEQQRLLQTLDPSLIAFLKHKNKSQTSTKPEQEDEAMQT